MAAFSPSLLSGRVSKETAARDRVGISSLSPRAGLSLGARLERPPGSGPGREGNSRRDWLSRGFPEAVYTEPPRSPGPVCDHGKQNILNKPQASVRRKFT